MRLRRARNVAVFFIVCFTALIGYAADASPIQRVEPCVMPESAHQTRAWTILFYCDADGDAVNVTDEFAIRLLSTELVNVLVLEDPSGEEATVWRVEGDQQEITLRGLELWGEIDMGDMSTLSRLLGFAQAWYPAERVMVLFYGHGRGWQGACYDNDPMGDEADYLTPQEMQVALSDMGGVEALLFTAPCIMSAVEAAYELRQVAHLYVASEPVSSFNIWHGALQKLHQLINDQPDVSLEVLATTLLSEAEATYSREQVIDAYQIPEDRAQLIPYASLTAVLPDDLTSVVEALDEFSLALINSLDSSFISICRARERSQDFGVLEVVDIYDFAWNCQTIKGMLEASQNLMAVLPEALAGFFADPEGFSDAHGLSVYFPLSPEFYPGGLAAFHETFGFEAHRQSYQMAGHDFAQDTHWDEFLVAFYSKWME